MHFPVYLHIGFLRIHPHLFFELLAYSAAFQVYLVLRRKSGDVIDDFGRWWLTAAAAVGALFGSRLLGALENPASVVGNLRNPALLFSGQTIVGALIGGLLAVEWTKTRLHITRRTGDLFAIPLCVGIVVGRVGCFLTGVADRTGGNPTALPWGLDSGDGISRQPVQLYEIAFVLCLAIFLYRVSWRGYQEGDLFKLFMVAYFTFRLFVDYLKPEMRIFAGLSSIQWACVCMLLYYSRDIFRWMKSGLSLTALRTPSGLENGLYDN
jgi:phosphatidylglycerol:prolipoprotein diacylglycerol transferase